ncbi:glycosyl hydrolase [Rathayibacter oskolensis]|uniref:glycoside hydrolase family 26 protein n=1 Tax=Rathayibacter oskolensis TaxID=1891671 RepID=UPI00265FAFC3|nr:glycosyl hydrolase [Rathayibacter oskolensis]WKK70412.1 glycosyl hydrolase [Rathayibacter oskolensis]
MAPRSRAVPALALAALLAVTAGCAATAQETPADCVVRPAAEIVPEQGALFGVNLDWGSQTIEEYSRELGQRPAVAVAFADVPFTDAERDEVRSAAAQLRVSGGTLLLTLESIDGLAAVTDDVAADIAELAASVNATGVPVIIRFAHEMNGSWYAWGQQPAAYVETFRRVAAAVHAGAPGAAMMWAPNNADGYPFEGGVAAAEPRTADFALLDTTGDGVLSLDDDPYAPYYPGDDAVDWVGMSLYHWGSAHPWGENEMPEEGKFAAQLTGTYDGAAGDETAAPDFYQTYGVEHGKPVAVPETAALVVPRGDPEGELAIKRAWWQQVLSAETAARFPELKMINWFEWEKFEPEVQDEVSWAVVEDQETRRAFRADLPDGLVYSDLSSRCTGAPVAG